MDSGQDDERLSDEDAAAAAECLDFVEERRTLMQQELDREYAEACKATPEDQPKPDRSLFQVEELKETYLPVDDLDLPGCGPTTAGYADHILISRRQKRAELLDWKFGMWPVEKAEDNLQGIAYALGLFHTCPFLDSIRIWFKQPHLGLVTTAVFTRAQVPALYLRVQTVVARAREARQKNDFSTAKPGVPVCNFCGELGRCPAVCAIACKVGHKFHPLEIPEDITPSVLASPEQTKKCLFLTQALRVWCDAYRRQTTDRILRGDSPCPSGFAVHQMSKRELVDMKKFRTDALTYLTEAEFDSTLESSFGAVEEIIQKKAPRGQKKAMIKEFQDATLASGAVKKGESFSFLRAVAEKE